MVGKAMGILILVACGMAVFFFLIRKEIIGQGAYDEAESRVSMIVSYIVCYLIFTFCTWGFIMAVICGIRLIAGW